MHDPAFAPQSLKGIQFGVPETADRKCQKVGFLLGFPRMLLVQPSGTSYFEVFAAMTPRSPGFGGIHPKCSICGAEFLNWAAVWTPHDPAKQRKAAQHDHLSQPSFYNLPGIETWPCTGNPFVEIKKSPSSARHSSPRAGSWPRLRQGRAELLAAQQALFQTALYEPSARFNIPFTTSLWLVWLPRVHAA